MCGICGIMDMTLKKRVTSGIIRNMMSRLAHRGPDFSDYYEDKNVALGFTRLSIIDIEGGNQPIFNEDKSLVLICNGEIFNYLELSKSLKSKGHQFKTKTDVEVILHLYEEFGIRLLEHLNGQFAFAIYDLKNKKMVCARDEFGIIPFYYTEAEGQFIFASEIKSILEYPIVEKQLDLNGLDHIFSFPGLIGSQTMFKNINNLENGHYLIINDKGIAKKQYWDLSYPKENDYKYLNDENKYLEQLNELFTSSIKLRMRSDVSLGCYLSGGLDSSFILSKMVECEPDNSIHTFSIGFEEAEKCESKFQKLVSSTFNTIHKEHQFYFDDISDRLDKVIYHSEHPIKETYNTASFALSQLARNNNIKVILCGEGADEWFAGYPGYKFDKFRLLSQNHMKSSSSKLADIKEMLWGNREIDFETGLFEYLQIKDELFIDDLSSQLNNIHEPLIEIDKIAGRDILHQRSYLDFKLRLVNHLVADHGDRMAYANSVEVRYPFLDKKLVNFISQLPPSLKLFNFNEKYLLKKLASNYIPKTIIEREKFAFHAPGSPYLLKRNNEFIQDMLSFDTIQRQGIFNPYYVEKLKKQYLEPNFQLDIPYQNDILLIILTFEIFVRQFKFFV